MDEQKDYKIVVETLLDSREQRDYILVKSIFFALIADRVIYPLEMVFGKQEAEKMKFPLAKLLAAWWDEWTSTEEFQKEHGLGKWKTI